ncbi:Inhibitor of growth protein 5 [Picochlorum sp. SENEW3]|nr:Inhibitor of growth protein 5 [Picochlorum sp. SENEW3]
MASYLRAFIEGVTELPDELKRHFRGLRELDARVNSLQKKLDEDMVLQLKNAAAAPVSNGKAKRQKSNAQKGVQDQDIGDPDLARRIHENMNQIMMISEEKVKRAQQVYDLVDQHIRKLDKDLKNFGAEVSKERDRLDIPVPVREQKNTVDLSSGRKRKETPRSDAEAPVEVDPNMSAEQLYQEALAVTDPNEPKYCYCNRISFGEMIACENDDCPIEWFHFGCVGLTPENRPVGQWFCDECKAELRRQKQIK